MVVTSTPIALLRLDEPVLRWLPELNAASEVTGVPANLLASVVRVVSEGDPSRVSTADGRGLMQVPAAELVRQGVPESDWHDPATNLVAGARLLANDRHPGESWRTAVARYLVDGCAGNEDCIAAYTEAIVNWRVN